MDNFDVKKIRERFNITQKELAKKLGVSRNTIINYEKGGKIPASKHAILNNLIKDEEAKMINKDSNFVSEQTTNYNVKKKHPIDTEKALLLKAIERMTITADKMADTANQITNTLNTNCKTVARLVDFLINNKSMNIDDINASLENPKGEDQEQKFDNDDDARDV